MSPDGVSFCEERLRLRIRHIQHVVDVDHRSLPAGIPALRQVRDSLLHGGQVQSAVLSRLVARRLGSHSGHSVATGFTDIDRRTLRRGARPAHARPTAKVGCGKSARVCYLRLRKEAGDQRARKQFIEQAWPPITFHLSRIWPPRRCSRGRPARARAVTRGSAALEDAGSSRVFTGALPVLLYALHEYGRARLCRLPGRNGDHIVRENDYVIVNVVRRRRSRSIAAPAPEETSPERQRDGGHRRRVPACCSSEEALRSRPWGREWRSRRFRARLPCRSHQTTQTQRAQQAPHRRERVVRRTQRAAWRE